MVSTHYKTETYVRKKMWVMLSHQLGRNAEERGNSGEAAALYRRSETLFLRLDDPHNLGIVQESLRRVETS